MEDEQNIKTEVDILQQEKNLNAFTVCSTVGIGVQTLSNWYRCQKNGMLDSSLPPLPQFYQLNEHSVRLWSKEDVEKLKLFKQSLGRGRAGKMGNWNSRYWQDRGKRALQNKENRKNSERDKE